MVAVVDLEVILEDIVQPQVQEVLAEAELEMAELDKQTPEAVEAVDILTQVVVNNQELVVLVKYK
tara:strand:+ start:171 stop:365 length:195 start_codon:yes stop_codon:yes gene_type:complete